MRSYSYFVQKISSIITDVCKYLRDLGQCIGAKTRQLSIIFFSELGFKSSG
jgi:hypothetical protein